MSDSIEHNIVTLMNGRGAVLFNSGRNCFGLKSQASTVPDIAMMQVKKPSDGASVCQSDRYYYRILGESLLMDRSTFTLKAFVVNRGILGNQ